MKKIITMILVSLLLFVFVPINSVFAYQGGLLQGKLPSSKSGTTFGDIGITDNDLNSSATMYPSSWIQYKLDSPIDVDKVFIKGGNFSGFTVTFYNENGVILKQFNTTSSTPNATTTIAHNGFTTIDVKQVDRVRVQPNHANNSGDLFEFDIYGLKPVIPTTNVTNLRVINLSKTSLSLAWTNPNDVNFYGTKVYRGTTLLKTSNETVSSFDVNNLQADTNYTFKVTSLNSDGSETDGATINVKTLENTPNVSELTALNVTRNSVLLKWKNPTNVTFNGTKIYNGSTLIGNFSKTVDSYEVTGLSHSTEYTFKVVAKDTDGSETNGVSLIVETKPLEPVENVTNVALTTTHNRVNLSWKLPQQEEFKHVNIYREKVEKEPSLLERIFSFSSVAYAADTKIFETNGTYFNDLTVQPESTYEYTLTTQTADNRESEGVTVVAETKQEPTPVLKDDGFSVEANGDYVFKWTEPTTGKVKVLIGSSEYKIVDASLKQVVIPKEQMKFTTFGEPNVSLVPISPYGKEGATARPGGMTENIKMPFETSELLLVTMGLMKIIGPILLLTICFLLYRRFKDSIYNAIANYKEKWRAKG